MDDLPLAKPVAEPSHPAHKSRTSFGEAGTHVVLLDAGTLWKELEKYDHRFCANIGRVEV